MAQMVCPVWIGYLLASPLRKLIQNPDKILAPHVKKGMTAMDIGCAMGFFSLPAARMVGPEGRVVCVDLQEKMIQALEKRAGKAGVQDRIHPHICSQRSLVLAEFSGQIDFSLVMAVVHEVPDPAGFFAEIFSAMKPGGRVLVAEPKGHVSKSAFEDTIAHAQESGLKLIDRPHVGRSHAALFEKVP